MIDYKMISKSIYIEYDNYDKIDYTVFIMKENDEYKLFKTKDQRVNKQTIDKIQPENYIIKKVYLEVENSSDEEVFENKIKIGFVGKNK